MKKLQGGILNAIQNFESQFRCAVPQLAAEVNLKIKRKKSEEPKQLVLDRLIVK